MAAEEYRVTHTPTATVVKCILTEVDPTKNKTMIVSWTSKTYATQVKPAVIEARVMAYEALSELKANTP